MTDPVNIVTITLRTAGDGTALEKRDDVSTFDLTAVALDPAKGTVSYVPDPDNSAHTIFWVRDADPNVDVQVLLTYPAL